MRDQKNEKQAIFETLKICTDYLEKLSKTCCMKERSKSMLGLISQFKQLDQNLKNKQSDEAALNNAIEQVTVLGGSIGALHVSCCTKTRESLYQELLRSLNKVHTGLWVLKGVSH